MVALAPLDRSLNAAVWQMVRVHVGRFRVSPRAPDTFATLRAHWEATREVCVWNGASECTIFGDPYTNYAFRAWHDRAHLSGGFEFTLDGERATAQLQIAQLAAWYDAELDAAPWLACRAREQRLARWQRMIEIEVIEQAEHYARFGEFPTDQRAFMQRRLGQ